MDYLLPSPAPLSLRSLSLISPSLQHIRFSTSGKQFCSASTSNNKPCNTRSCERHETRLARLATVPYLTTQYSSSKQYVPLFFVAFLAALLTTPLRFAEWIQDHWGTTGSSNFLAFVQDPFDPSNTIPVLRVMYAKGSYASDVPGGVSGGMTRRSARTKLTTLLLLEGWVLPRRLWRELCSKSIVELSVEYLRLLLKR